MIFPGAMTEKDLAKRAKLLRLLFPAVGVLTTLFGLLAFLFSADEQGRYLVPSVLTVLFYLCLTVGILLVPAVLFLLPRSCDAEATDSTFSSLVGMIPAAASLFCMVNAAAALFQSSELAFMPAVILCGLGSLLFCMAKLIKLPLIPTLLCGYVQVLFCAVVICQLYLDRTVEMNHPLKLLLQFSMAAMILGTLAALYPLVGRSRCGRRKLIASVLVLTLCLSSGVIGLILFFKGNINVTYGCYALLSLAFGIQELFSISSLKLKASSPGEMADPTAEYDSI